MLTQGKVSRWVSINMTINVVSHLGIPYAVAIMHPDSHSLTMPAALTSGLHSGHYQTDTVTCKRLQCHTYKTWNPLLPQCVCQAVTFGQERQSLTLDCTIPHKLVSSTSESMLLTGSPYVTNQIF